MNTRVRLDREEVRRFVRRVSALANPRDHTSDTVLVSLVDNRLILRILNNAFAGEAYQLSKQFALG